MNGDPEPSGGSSRRQLLVAAVAGGGGAAAVLVASCAGTDGAPKRADSVSTVEAQSDGAILGALLDLERSSIAAYAFAARRMRGGAGRSARTFIDHERRHAAALERLIGRLGGVPSRARPASEYQATFPRLRGHRDALSFVLDIETTAIDAYADALGKIASDRARVTAAAILTTEAEHASVLLGELGRPAVPQAFVTGAPPEAAP